MSLEIERKFLVAGAGWQSQSALSVAIAQFYLANTDKAVIRLRIVDEEEAFLTIKSAVKGSIRSEFEHSVPVEEARAMMEMRQGLVIKKRRHFVPWGDLRWEIDVFEGAHAGLVIAEIELPTADTPFERPDWLGREVTGIRSYYNADLAIRRPV
jgi:adenylate cyclase